jgi:short-subunit dehydrogenase involved in D-alanine esterification of teichoic acids
MDQEEKTQDGLEAHVGVNHLAHFLLTNILIDKVARVVIVSSGLMLSGQSKFPAGKKLLKNTNHFISKWPTF